MPHDHPHPHQHEHEHAHEHEHEHEHEHAHAHAHAHAHEHEHGHGHAHAHEHGHELTREDLPRGAGAGKVLFLDAPSGLAGDMIVAALVDLGAPVAALHEALSQLDVHGFHVHFGARARSGIVATSFDVHVEEAQPERTYGSIRRLLEESSLSASVKARASATFHKLALSEAKVHRAPLEDVHFHEVGAVDAIVDIVGSAALLDWLGAEVRVSPLPMGRGFVEARHGVLPLPAPAAVECLVGFETYDAGIEAELVTPTGAAIVAAHATGSVGWPRFVPERIGWGAGTKDLADRPNLLRAVLGSAPKSRVGMAPGDPHGDHVVLEANIDDASGELMGHTIETLLALGAKDAWAVPVTMKKGRPGLTLSALATEEQADAIAHAILRETTSIGVRFHRVARLERPRRLVTVTTPFGDLPVKVSEGAFGPAQAKPEFDACAEAARRHGVPVRVVLLAALRAFSPLG